jgi:hypothetical protein
MRYKALDTSLMSATVGPEGVSDVVLVNGLWQPTLALTTGSWHRFELVNAVGDVYQEIEIRSGVALLGGGSTACSMKLLALVRSRGHPEHRLAA